MDLPPLGLPGLNLPSLQSLPLQQSSSATSRSGDTGGTSGMFGGDWIVNLGGSGTSLQGAAAGSSLLLVAAALAAGAWLLLRKG